MGTTPPRYYYPRCRFEIAVPSSDIPEDREEQGDIRFQLPVRSARWELNDHNHADELTITASALDCPFDPRLLKDSLGTFWVGDAKGPNPLPINDDNFKFVGIVKRVKRINNEGTADVELTLHDYTSMFLDVKQFPASGMPELSMRLDEAWRRICDFTGPRIPGTNKVASSVKRLRDNIVLEGGLKSFPVIGTASTDRFQKQGKVNPPTGADAWVVWQRCVGMCGLITFMRRDQCVVTTDIGYYSHGNHPRLVWGENLTSLSEEYDSALASTGIIITSFDTLTNTSIEVYWPPVGDVSVKRSRATAKPRKKKPFTEDEIRQSEQREALAYPEVTDTKRLLEIAQLVFGERSRQQLEGVAKTSEFTVGARRSIGGVSRRTQNDRDELLTRGVDETTFDLLNLEPGNDIRIEIQEDTRTELLQFETIEERIKYLRSKGYAEGPAQILARNVERLRQFSPVFHVKTVTVSLDENPDGGSFDIEIGYHNRYVLSKEDPPVETQDDE